MPILKWCSEPEDPPITTLEELEKRLDSASKEIRWASLLTYLRSAKTTVSGKSADALVKDFTRAGELMGASARQASFDETIHWNLRLAKALMRGAAFDSPNKACNRSVEIENCIRRIVGIIMTFGCTYMTLEIAIRFMLKANVPEHDGIRLNIRPSFGYEAARIMASKRDTPGLTLAECGEWRDHILSHNQSLDRSEFEALKDIEQRNFFLIHSPQR